MAETFEEKYLGLLQNLELSIVEFSREHPELLDYDVEAVLDVLIALYTAELRGRAARERRLAGLREPLFDEVRSTCEWNLGRAALADEPDSFAPYTVNELVACLKRVRKSVRMWTREAGRRGYINFAQQYVI